MKPCVSQQRLVAPNRHHAFQQLERLFGIGNSSGIDARSQRVAGLARQPAFNVGRGSVDALVAKDEGRAGIEPVMHLLD